MSTVNDDARMAGARKHIKELKGFYGHAIVFAGVMTLLFVINLLTRGEWWVQWPLMGWGFGLLVHGVAVYFKASTPLKDWEDRKIKQLLDG
jgi:2TM domain